MGASNFSIVAAPSTSPIIAPPKPPESFDSIAHPDHEPFAPEARYTPPPLPAYEDVSAAGARVPRPIARKQPLHDFKVTLMGFRSAYAGPVPNTVESCPDDKWVDTMDPVTGITTPSLVGLRASLVVSTIEQARGRARSYSRTAV